LVNPIFTRVTTAMLARRGGLAIGLGDYIYAKYWYGGQPAGPDSRAVLDRRYRAFRRNEGRLAASMPVLLAIGNHEGVDETLVGSSTPFPGTAAWQAAFELPSAPGAGERYYSCDWRKRVHVVVLFSTKSGLGFAGPGQPGNSAQARWLIADLRRDHHPWTIVVLHHPLYDPRYGHAWFANPAERDRLASFLWQKGVDLVVQGHDHLYRRHVQNGVPYITQGGAGAELSLAVLGDANDVVRYSEWGFSEIELRDGYRQATLRAWIVEDDGSVRLGDRVALRRNPRH
jgi:3',5'-cyclic AMP phosphodiesterase CpdA